MPRMEADFDWGDVQASTPIYTKAVYELTIVGVRGRAWAMQEGGVPTGEVGKAVNLRAKMVGVYDSAGELKTEQDGKDIAGGSVEEIPLWLRTKGGRQMAKGHMMAILGYNSNDQASEDEYMEFIKDSGSDITVTTEENEAGDGFTLILGDGWESLFVGKNVKAHMEPQTRNIEGRDPIIQQNFTRLVPVNL